MAEMVTIDAETNCYYRVRALSVDSRRLSVCLSVCPVPDPKLRMEGHRMLKIDW